MRHTIGFWIVLRGVYSRQTHEEMSMPDLQRFKDPIAEETQWDRLVAGGASFKTHSLQQDLNGTIQFKSTLGSKLFAGLFIVVPLPFTLFLFFTKWIIPLVLFFMIMGSVLLYKTLTPIVFNLERGYFHKGWMSKNVSLQLQNIEWCEIDDIHALQIISEYVSGDIDSPSFKSYELNIVKRDASRVNVIDHGGLQSLRSDAKILAKILGVPVWDATL